MVHGFMVIVNMIEERAFLSWLKPLADNTFYFFSRSLNSPLVKKLPGPTSVATQESSGRKCP